MKKVLIIFSAAMVIILCSLSVCAVDSSLENDLKQQLISAVDDDVFEVLEQFGIESFDGIYNVSFDNIISYFKNFFEDKLMSSARMFLKLLAMMCILSFVSSVINDDKSRAVLVFLSSAAAVIICIEDINSCLNAGISVLNMSATFMKAFVPVFAVIIAVSGTPTAALTYSSAVLFIGEIITFVINNGIVDIIGAFLCIGIAFSLNSEMKTSSVVSFVNKITSLIMGLCAGVYTSVLSIKGVLAYSSDSVATKGVRFLVSSLIPVVGSSISEAYSSLLGSINIIKGSFAVVGIIVTVIINIPIIAEILLYHLSMKLLSFIGELLSLKALSDIFSVFSSAVRIILFLTVYQLFVLVISTGIIISFRGG